MKFNIYTESQVQELKEKIKRLEEENDNLMSDLILYKIPPYFTYEEE